MDAPDDRHDADAMPPEAASPPPEGDFLPGDEVIDVEGEPVSRGEAKRLGLLDLDAGSGPDAEAAVPPTIGENAKGQAGRTGSVPLVIAPAVFDKILAAEKFLDAGSMEDALALAQEAVREQPSLPEARIVMARAFMGQGDHAKALSILQALPSGEQTADTLYYRGLANAKLNRPAEAAKLLDASVALAGGDPLLKKHARELAARLKSTPGREPRAASGFAGITQPHRPTPLARRERRRRRSRSTMVFCLVLLAALTLIGAHFVFPQILSAALARLGDAFSAVIR